MKLQIEIDSRNAAIVDNPQGELKTILAICGQVVAKMAYLPPKENWEYPLFDSNGNRVGLFTIQK